MIAPVYQMQSVSPQIECAMGKAWAALAIDEGHRPAHLRESIGVKAEVQCEILMIVKKHKVVYAALVASELCEAASRCSNYLVSMVAGGILDKRLAMPFEAPPATRWVYFKREEI